MKGTNNISLKKPTPPALKKERKKEKGDVPGKNKIRALQSIL